MKNVSSCISTEASDVHIGIIIVIVIVDIEIVYVLVVVINDQWKR